VVAKPGDVVDVPELGVRFEFRQTASETGGELTELDAIGRPRGFLLQTHVHAGQSEHHEMIEGAVEIRVGGRKHVLHPGDTLEIPPDTPHSQRPAGDGPGRVRIQTRPSLRIEEFIERLGELSRTGQLLRSGYPRPLAAAAFVRDLGEAGHAPFPPVRVQQAIAGALLRSAAWLRGLRGGAGREYVFVDEWDVNAPREAVFDTLADAATYPRWWRPVYIGVETDGGPPAVGKRTRQHFKGRLPYHLHTETQTVRLERPHVIEGDTTGDLAGHGIWTLTEGPGGGTHVQFDWRVVADRPLLKALTPVLRPALRWNHNWAIARAIEGLEPYVNGSPAR
jgi:mannose-6-phosphate isomerase-like protein (cupin superfamily)/uncharacterized protein YndB with AHSA1/START domain